MKSPAHRTPTGMHLRAGRLLALAAGVLTATGCGIVGGGSGGSSPAMPPGAVDAAGPDVESVNRRILAAAALDSAAAGGRDIDEDYRIGPRDELAIEVFGAESFSGTHQVGESGTISMPLLGPVQAAGMNPRELEASLEKRLAETYMRDPHVTVQVTEVRSHGVSVIGAVRTPGVYQVSGRASLLEVLAMAEGLSEEAGTTVHVVRRGVREGAPPPAALATDDGTGMDGTDGVLASEEALAEAVVEVDLNALLTTGRTEQNIDIQPGDIVQVRPAGLVYVVGQVNRPGGFTVPPGSPMSVLQALAMAEGLGNTAAASRSVIVRQHDNGTREEIEVDLEEVLEGSAPPPHLMARDVLFVPNNDTKSAALGVVNALVRMVSLRGLFY